MNTEQMLVAGATDLVIETKRHVELRTPTLDDVDAIGALIGAWAEQGLTLARPHEDIASHFHDNRTHWNFQTSSKARSQ
jgi:hypothetical protein